MFTALEHALGHRFADPGLLRTALTHRSHSSPHNERLEFLGDSVLDAVIARELFERFPEIPEGVLSRLRANLVRQDSLHRLAVALSLGEHLRLGDGELKSGGRERPSMLADAMEAVFGAIWLDAGFTAAHAAIVRLYAEMLEAAAPEKKIKDAKSILQEALQGRRLPLPTYALIGASGEAHARFFKASCEIPALGLKTEGEGVTRRIAEQNAAERILERLPPS